MTTPVKCLAILTNDERPVPCAYVIERDPGNDTTCWDVYTVADPHLNHRATFVNDQNAAVDFAEEHHC